MSSKRHREQKLRERRQRIRKEKHEHRSLPKEIRQATESGAADHREAGPDEAPELAGTRGPTPVVSSRPGLASERVLRELHSILKEHDFKSIEEANAFLQQNQGLKAEEIRERRKGVLDPREEAQELAYQAMECESRSRGIDLAEQALALDPDCADALVTLANATADSRTDLIAGLRKAVEAGERSLGQELFKKNRGDFWGIIETRSYMRARFGLAEALLRNGETAEAILHYEALLELNRNDNQGVRYELLPCYLVLRDLFGARRLLKKSRAEIGWNACFSWGLVLERYLSGDLKGAASALPAARGQNPHMEAYLTGREMLPRELPAFYRPGEQDEAATYAEPVRRAWRNYPEAIRWLETQ